jgi:Family of unknown function (DUF6338)
MVLPATFQAILVIAFAVLPGAAFVYALERTLGAWGVKAADRFLRFIALSALAYVALVPYGYRLYRELVLSKYLILAKPFPWRPYLILVLVLGVVPALLGTAAGAAIARNTRWVIRLFGQHATWPRAWDYTFRKGRNGWVRILVKADKPKWVAGSYTTEVDDQAYVAAYPEDSDIYLPVRVECDEATGEFVFGDDGKPAKVDNVGILVRASEIAYLEFIPG